MKFFKMLMLSSIFTLLIPAIGFAGAKNEGTMNLTEPAVIGSAQLKPGTYKVQWDGSGSDVHINILQHKNTVATTTGQLKTNDKAVSDDAVILAPASNNSSQKQIAEIDFAKHKEALVINSTSTGGM
jgi:hypothetical protein